MRLAPMTAGLAALIAAALTVGGSFAGAQEASRAVLDPKTAHVKAETGEIVLVDIRTPEEWRETGVPASAHAITMNQQPTAFLNALATVAGTDKSKPIALICRTGNRSAHLAAELRKAGFTNIFDVAEGVAGGRNGSGWLRAGLPLRKGADVLARPVVAGAQ